VFDNIENGSADSIDLDGGANGATGGTLNLADDQFLISFTQGQTIDLSTFGVTGGGGTGNFLFNGNTPTGASSTITAPGAGGNIDTAHVVLESALNAVEINDVSATLVNVVATSTGLDAITYTGAGTGHAIRLENVTARSSSGIALNIDPSSGSTLTLSGWGNIAESIGVGQPLNIGGGVIDAGGLTFAGVTSAGTTGASDSVSISNITGGDLNLSNLNIIASGTGDAVGIANVSSNVNIAGGGNSIAVTDGIGYHATGNTGAVTVQGTGNTILVTGSGQALVIENTDIGAADVTFESISRLSTPATSAIIQNNTGVAGSLIVTGTGTTAGSGGFLVGAGTGDFPTVLISGDANTSLSNMVIRSGTSEAIDVITPTGTAVNFNFDNITAETTGVHTGGVTAVIEIDHAGTGTIDGRIVNSNIQTLDGTNPAEGIFAEVDGSGDVSLLIDNNTIAIAGDGQGLEGFVQATATGSLDVTFTNNIVSVAGTTDDFNAGFSLTNNSTTGAACVDIAGNSFAPVTGTGFHVGEEVFIGHGIGATGTFNVVQLLAGDDGFTTDFDVDTDDVETRISAANGSANVLALEEPGELFGIAASCSAPASVP
jgi:hypothetical protein